MGMNQASHNHFVDAEEEFRRLDLAGVSWRNAALFADRFEPFIAVARHVLAREQKQFEADRDGEPKTLKVRVSNYVAVEVFHPMELGGEGG